jgi:predicted MFS family arabinose efflux permease
MGGDPFVPLRVPLFRQLWLSSLFLNLGFLMQNVAASWVIFEKTGSPMWVSLMLGAPLLPLLLLSMPAGAAADLLDRRRLLAIASAIMAAATGGMAVAWLSGEVSPELFVALGLLVGVGDSLFNPAWSAIIPAVVPASAVPSAVALNSACGGIAVALGPAVGGLMISFGGPGWTLVAALAGYVPIIWVLLSSRTTKRTRNDDSIAIATTNGLRYLWFSSAYRSLLLVACIFGVASAALLAMLPNITHDVLLGGSAVYGGLLGAFGIGAVIGGMTRSVGANLLAGRLVPVGILLYSVAGIVVSLTRDSVLSACAILIAGAMWTWVLATLNSTFQALTPDWVRGRVMAAYVVAVFGFKAIGSIGAGVLGDRVGVASSLFAFSALMIPLALVVANMGLPILEQINSPVSAEAINSGDLKPAGDGESERAQVMVVNSWQVAAPDLAAFLDQLGRLRRFRLSTGAYRWNVYRKMADPLQAASTTISEVYYVHSWVHYLEHTERLDAQAQSLIRQVNALSRPETCTRRYFVAVK